MKNKQRFLIIALAFILSMLSGCKLVDRPAANGDEALPPLSFKEDYLTGFIIYVSVGEEGHEKTYYPTNDFNDDNVWCVYFKQEFFESDNGHTPYCTTVCKGDFDLIKFSITNGAEPNGKIEIEATFYYTYQLIGQVAYTDGIFQTQDYQYYTQGLTGHYLSNFGNGSLTYKQTLEASRTGLDGIKQVITFEAENTLNLKLIDYLTNARVLEFDKNHKLINTSEIELSLSEKGIKFDTLSECEYVILEKDYKVMHEDMREGIEKEYTQKVIIDSKNAKTETEIYIPKGDGFVKKQSLKINFS